MKLTKKQEKRWWEFFGDYCEADIVGDGEEFKKHLVEELALQAHDNEILVNTILDDKKRELALQKKEMVEIIKNDADKDGFCNAEYLIETILED